MVASCKRVYRHHRSVVPLRPQHPLNACGRLVILAARAVEYNPLRRPMNMLGASRMDVREGEGVYLGKHVGLLHGELGFEVLRGLECQLFALLLSHQDTNPATAL